ncbi:efflux RND transporter periplasmic adaptor subunit [Clostridiaceae bacterium 35-E11]
MIKSFFSSKYTKLIIVILILGISFSGFILINKTTASSSDEITTKEEKVQKGDITIGFTGDGEAEIPVVNLDFELSGKLKELYVKEGEQIKEGQILAKLDDKQYQNKLKTAEISYQKALASLGQKKESQKLNLISEKQKLDELKLKLEQVEAEYLPMTELEEYYSKQEINLKRIAYESAKAAYATQLERYNTLANSNKDLELETANVESAKINLEMAKDDLNNTILTAPLSAKVLKIAYKPGENISTVKETGQVTADTSHFMVVSDSDRVEVVVPVSEIDLSKVEIGQMVEVTFEAYEGESFNGKVTSIDALPKIEQSGLVTYDVSIALEKGLDKIKSGMTCTVFFILRQEKDVLMIPNKAVSIIDGKQAVKVKDQNGDIQIKNIKTGLTDGKYVSVREGLKVGETVLIENTKTE